MTTGASTKSRGAGELSTGGSNNLSLIFFPHPPNPHAARKSGLRALLGVPAVALFSTGRGLSATSDSSRLVSVVSGSYPVDEQVRDTLAYLKAVMTDDTLAQRVIADHGQLHLIADLFARMLLSATRSAGTDPLEYIDRMFAAAESTFPATT